MEQIPQARVLLDPVNVDLSPDGRLIWSPTDDRPSADAVVNFMAWVPQQLDPTAAGDVYPKVSITIAPKLTTSSRGLVSTMKELASFGSGVEGSSSPYDALGANLMEGVQQDGGKRSPVLGSKAYVDQRPWTGTKVILLSQTSAEAKRSKADRNVDDFPKSLYIYGYLVIDALNVASAQADKLAMDPELAAYYDPALYNKAVAGVSSQEDQNRWNALRTIRKTEADFLSHKSEALSSAILTGEFGDSFRTTRDTQDSSARKATVSGAFSLLKMAVEVAAQGATARSAPATSLAYGNQAMSTESSYLQQNEAISQSLAASIDPAVNLQVRVAIKIDEVSADVTAVSLTELREKLKAIYQRKYPNARNTGNAEAVTTGQMNGH